jgi:GTP cyclohydrolase IIa
VIVATATRLALIELVGYREWTEELGEDREWAIQLTQASLYRAAQDAAKEHGGFVIPLRYDYMVLLASSLDEAAHRDVVGAVASESPVPVRAASYCALSPLEALQGAQGVLRTLEPGGLKVAECRHGEATAVAHVDVNNITGETARKGAYDAFIGVLRLHYALAEEAWRVGAIVQYLGGDNILVVLPPEKPLETTRRILGRIEDALMPGDGLKAGVGLADLPREALRLAAKALHDIRAGLARELVVFYTQAPRAEIREGGFG